MPNLIQGVLTLILTCTVILSCISAGPVPDQGQLFHASKWQISGCGNSIIILGTKHSNDLPLTFDEETKTQVKAADVLALEVDEKEFESKENTDKLFEKETNLLNSNSNGLTAAYYRLNSLQSLELVLAYLPASERTLLLDRVKKVKGFDTDKYLKAPAKLFFAAYETYGSDEEPRKIITANGVEPALVRLRKGKNNLVVGLESMESVFTNSYYDFKPSEVDEQQFLMILSYNMQGIIDGLDDIALEKSYIKGDLSVPTKFRAMERKKWTAKNYEKMYLNRENNFAKKLVELGQNKSVFAAIGLLHLVGDDSVPSILEKTYNCKVTKL